MGNRTSLTDRRGPKNFGYDALGRLTAASHPLLLDPQTFAYDLVGNRTTNGSVVNAGNQLTADANVTYQYDDNGNLTRKTLLATGNYTQYSYDAENRLIQVQEFAAGNSTAITTSSYRYDGLGRRIEKVANGQTSRYIYDGEDILLEYNGSNVLQARYTHGPGIDEPLAVTKGGSTFFYHQDGLGTVTELTDSTGSVAKAYAYDAYGNILESPGTVNQPYTYTGRELDSETGLYYYRARYYDAATGRFMQKDPIGFWGADINLYRYVLNGPVNNVDPRGTDIAVIENRATAGNPAGHTAIAISGYGVLSYGNGTQLGTDLSSYVARESANRETLIYLIRTTPDQDAAALASLLGEEGRLRGIFSDNCATRTNKALDAIGLPDTLAPNFLPGSAGARAEASGVKPFFVPLHEPRLPAGFEQFQLPR
ncbi:MAG: hypothetical protein LZF60_380016 [Nitrospira sp.]|nr:MAG: hypothetical protein LZF60_380016 [Nitrospira sp.]